METFVNDDGEVIQVIEKIIEIRYSVHGLEMVQRKVERQYRNTGKRRDDNDLASLTNAGSKT
jgi:hypothetical protein